MIDNKCLNDIRTNINPGVEYEIALFYTLCQACRYDVKALEKAINLRSDCNKIHSIIAFSSPACIVNELSSRGLNLTDVSFETQNDAVGPADIVLTVESADGSTSLIGLSVKYANTCTLNVTGRRFLSDNQIASLKGKLAHYTNLYIDEMNRKYGDISNWFRKRKASHTTDDFVDLIRDAVISNWPNIRDKSDLFAALYHSDSPIEFWVVKYSDRGYTLNIRPMTIDFSRVEDIEVRKFQTSYLAFYLDGVRIGHMQVKFNNGFVEKCKKKKPDIVEQGIAISYGQPFSSWNFSVEE